jgi:mono/diheme cytochrome c family protein
MRPVSLRLLLVAVVSSWALAAAAAEPKPKAPKLSPELAAKGRTTFQALCASCHGDKGDGQGPAGLYLNPKPRHFEKDPFKQGESVEQIFATLATGVPGTAMVAYAHLPEEDRWAVAWYVHQFRPSKDGKKAKKVFDALPPTSPPGSTAPAPAAAPAAAPTAPAPTAPAPTAPAPTAPAPTAPAPTAPAPTAPAPH